MEFYTLKIRKRIQESSDSCSLQFSVPQELKNAFNYKSGQYLTIKLNIDAKEERRAYSISSCPTCDDPIQITIKNIDGGLVSSYLVSNVKEGDILEVFPPMGNFVLEPNPETQKQYFMLAGGSGITPLMSMLKTVLFNEPLSKVVLIYSNRFPENIIFKDELEKLAKKYSDRFKIYHFISRANQEDMAYFGRLEPELFKEIALKHTNGNFDNAEFYLCGPTSLMQSIENLILEFDIPKSKIHKESFVSSNLYDEDEKPQHAEYQDHTIKIRVYGQEYDLHVQKEDNIITAGIKNGLIFPYSCQIGACSTCRAMLVKGKVHMEITEGLTDVEIKQGYILTCQAHPMSDDVLVDFDY